LIAIDTSALAAILRSEPERDTLTRAILVAERRLMCAVSLFEASMVAISRGVRELGEPLDRLIERLSIELVPFDTALAIESREAFIRYGRGRHPAGLNFGDCISYALAKSRDLPLLFKGGDFAKTDIVSALA
jgi:ribonuclease VapC